MITIRKAQLRDAENLSRLAEQTFRDTFAATNTAADMDLHALKHYSIAIQTQEIGNPGVHTLVCEAGDALIAFAQLRWDATEACVVGGVPAEIQRFYVAHGYHGRGIAQNMMEACLAAIREHGADVAWLGVWEHNPRAIAFYQKFGFVAVGEHVFAVGTDPQRDLVMSRPVGAV